MNTKVALAERASTPGKGKRVMHGKRVQFDDESWDSVDLLAKDRMMAFQELADEAFRDILKKYGRPASLKEALRRSASRSADVVPPKGGKKKRAQKNRAKKRR